MSREQRVIDATPHPLTQPELVRDLRALGLQTGDVVLVHTALSRIGWVIGGAATVIEALLETVGAGGTVMVPTQTGDNSDPSLWGNPPVPKSWWPHIREHMPAYDPAKTPPRGMGRLPETFWRWPGVMRSRHPQLSFAASGHHAEALITAEPPLDNALGDESPLGMLYQLNGRVLLLGASHSSNTSLHLSESRATYPHKQTETQGAAMFVDGVRQWVTFRQIAWDTYDFERIGAAFAEAHPEHIQRGTVGLAACELIMQRPLVNFGTVYMEKNRGSHPYKFTNF